MQKSDQKKSYQELIADLQRILTSVENPDSNPDLWEEQVQQAQSLLKECRERLRRIEGNLNPTQEKPPTIIDGSKDFLEGI